MCRRSWELYHVLGSLGGRIDSSVSPGEKDRGLRMRTTMRISVAVRFHELAGVANEVL